MMSFLRIAAILMTVLAWIRTMGQTDVYAFSWETQEAASVVVRTYKVVFAARSVECAYNLWVIDDPLGIEQHRPSPPFRHAIEFPIPRYSPLKMESDPPFPTVDVGGVQFLAWKAAVEEGPWKDRITNLIVIVPLPLVLELMLRPEFLV